MIVLLGLFTRVIFSPERVEALQERVRGDEAPTHHHGQEEPRRARLRDRETLVAAARYTTGDLTMIRTELAVGFVVAGFLSAHVPTTWWHHLFVSGHAAFGRCSRTSRSRRSLRYSRASAR
jgi:hypothetical protein